MLFADLVSSSEFSSILSLEAYADYVATFESICTRQCNHFFEKFHQGDYRRGTDYQLELLGDELVVFLHTHQQSDDVYQLICLAIALKCAWLASPVNVERINQGAPAVEMAIGIHAGLIWATPNQESYVLRGFAINVAKRVETASREGEHFRIFVSGAAFKRVNRRIRHLLFGPRRLVPMKGIVLPVAVHELIDSFVEPSCRMLPDFVERFTEVAEKAIASNSFDMWIHSCFQLAQGQLNACVTNESLELCKNALNIQPENAVALYYAAEALIERGEFASAILYLNDLTRLWPTFTDGWLELGRTARRIGDLQLASHAILQARRHGAGVDEEPLPTATE